MKLIAGLGNPGKKYANTRHNLGFHVIDAFRWQRGIKAKKPLFGCARQGQTTIKGQELVLIQPLTFMNSSGECIRRYIDKYEVFLDSILIVCDDINLPLGQLRIRPQGSSGGHNGLDSVIRNLHSMQFSRLRIGVGPISEGYNISEYVLSNFVDSEKKVIKYAVEHAANACECWTTDGIEKAMSQFNK